VGGLLKNSSSHGENGGSNPPGTATKKTGVTVETVAPFPFLHFTHTITHTIGPLNWGGGFRRLAPSSHCHCPAFAPTVQRVTGLLALPEHFSGEDGGEYKGGPPIADSRTFSDQSVIVLLCFSFPIPCRGAPHAVPPKETMGV